MPPLDQFWLPLFIARAQDLGLASRPLFGFYGGRYSPASMIAIWNHLHDYNHPSNRHFDRPAFWFVDVDQLCAFSADHCDE
jgi:hypothetical protein